MSPKTKKSSRLSERAMLTHIRVSYWSGAKKNKKVTREVVTAKSAVSDVGHWIDKLIPQSELKPVTELRTRIRYTWTNLTLPWMDGGVRILPSKMFMDYREKMNAVVRDYNKAVDAFLKRYPSIIEKRKKDFGDLWKDYEGYIPSVNELRDKFAVHQDIYPMPDASDFRVDIGTEESAEIREQVEASINAATQKAMSDLWNQLADLIGMVEKTLGNPKAVFRDSLINNLSEFCKLIPKMDFVGDSNLNSIRTEVISKLANLKPIDLRESTSDRKKAVKAAKDILKKIDTKGIEL
jgi:hypothetical protein